MNVSLLNYEDRVKARVRSGEFANASEFIRHCIRVAEAVESRFGPAGASFRSRDELERLLLEARETEAEPMTEARWAKVYARAGVARG